MKYLNFALVFALLAVAMVSHAQTLENELSSHIDIIVDIDGNGNYTSVNEAIAAVPDNSAERTVIFIRNGKYIEKVEIPSTKNNLTIVGEHIDKTRISYDDYSGSGELYDGILNYKGQAIGTSTSHTLYTASENFHLMNLTVENTAGRVGQAVAINLHGDRQTLAHCRFLGNQDTFYTWGDGRFYISDSYIEGNVDFIFGRGAAYFEKSLIVSNRSDSDITAASTDQNWEFGYVFDSCKLEGLPGITDISLGRPWKPYAQVVFMNSYLGAHMAAEGWSEWGGNTNHETAYYAVFNNYGPGSNTEAYLEWTNVLTEAEAERYTIENIFSKDVRPSAFAQDWLPSLGTDPIYKVVKANTDDIFSDTLYYMPLLESISYKGKEIEDYNADYNLYTATVRTEEVDVSDIEVTTVDPEAEVSIKMPLSIPGNAAITVTARSSSTSKYLLKLWYEPLAVAESSKEHLIFPNPFGEHLNLSMPKVTHEAARLTLYDVSGARVLDIELNQHQLKSGLYTLNTSSLTKGIYTYRIKTSSDLFSGKIIKK